MQSIDSMKTQSYVTSIDLVSEKEEINKYRNIINQSKND